MSRVSAIIPARMGSTRLPGKPLLDLGGKPIIQWVYERTALAGCFEQVIVATPDQEICQRVEDFGGKAILTSPDHRSGTDRLAEVCRNTDVGDVVVNVQGDEPLIEPSVIAELARTLAENDSIPMASVMCPLDESDAISDPNLVKVVVDTKGFALYFSRSPIPYVRCAEGASRTFGHVGMYGYRKDFLLKFAALAPTPLEMAESLEQLRVLENGYRIKMIEAAARPVGVDTAEDLERVRGLVANKGVL